MSTKESGTFREIREHASAARQETKAAVRSLLPESFWEHAHASQSEAKLAFQAFRRAVKSQFCSRPAKESPPKQKIKIA